MHAKRELKRVNSPFQSTIRTGYGESLAVHLLDQFLSKADPPYGGKIAYGPGKGHCWLGLSERELMNEMAAAIEKGRAAKAVKDK